MRMRAFTYRTKSEPLAFNALERLLIDITPSLAYGEVRGSGTCGVIASHHVRNPPGTPPVDLFDRGRSPGLRIIAPILPSRHIAPVALSNEYSPLTVAGAAPALRRP
ncbi:hypothetical protein PMI41_00380 [Phyllobacterium sp. YR531]|nr:hypothetical protein PMI41_00380 [Phyllobacterium sp. YR531]